MKTLEQRLTYNSKFTACFEPIFMWLQMYRTAFPDDAPEEYVRVIDTLLQQLRMTQAVVLSIPNAFPNTTLLKSFDKARAGLNTVQARLTFLRELPHAAITQETRHFLHITAIAIKKAERALTRTMKALPPKVHLCSDHEADATASITFLLPLPLPLQPRTSHDVDTFTLFNCWWHQMTFDLEVLAGRADNAMDELAWVDYHVGELASMVKGEPRAFNQAQRDVIKLAASEIEKCEPMLVSARDLYLADDHDD